MPNSSLRLKPIDPAVSSFINQENSIQHRTRLKTESQIAKERKDKERTTLTVDLPAKLITSIKNLAGNEETTCSQIVGLLLVIGLTGLVNGKIDLHRFKVFSRSPRYDWKIRIPTIPTIRLKEVPKTQTEEVDVEPIEIEISVGTRVYANDSSSENSREFA